MKNSRRDFIKTSLLAGVGSTMLSTACATENKSGYTLNPDRYKKLDDALKKPVLKKELFPDPVIIESCELLEYNGNYLCRVRSKDGAEGFCVGHNIRMPHLFPIQLMLVNPFFEGKDARDLDSLIDGVFMYKNNYKYPH